MRHLPGRAGLGRKPGMATLLHLSGQIAHGLLRDDATLATGKGSFGFMECVKRLGVTLLLAEVPIFAVEA